MKICPKCGSTLEGPTKNSTYYCTNTNCTLYGVKYDRQGNIRRITETGFSSLALSRASTLTDNAPGISG